MASTAVTSLTDFSPPQEYFRQAQVWGKFAACLNSATEATFREAVALGPQLKKGGGLWMVESEHCHPLINWSRGVLKRYTDGVGWTSAWSDETIRDRLTREVWPLLILGGAKQWINTV